MRTEGEGVRVLYRLAKFDFKVAHPPGRMAS